MQRFGLSRLSLLSQFSLVSFLLMLAIAVALAYGIQYSLEQNALQQEAESAASQVATILDPNLEPRDLSEPLGAERYAQIDALIRRNVLRDHIVRVKIWSRDGTLLYADDQQYVGQRFEIEDELAEALAGHVGSDISQLDKAENASERGQYDQLLEVYVPLRPMSTAQVAGAYEIYHDLILLEPRIAAMRNFVWFSVGAGFLILYGSLFTLVRNASRELVRRNAENARLFRELTAAYDHTLDALAAALDARDKETEGHSRRVVAYTLALAHLMQVCPDDIATLRRGALLHDIGKIGVPDSILRKPGALDEAEWVIMRQHPQWGERILSGIPFLQSAAEIVCTHQERWDGKGYPSGLSGESIPLGARIFAVADTLDAITSDRPYRAARSYDVACREIVQARGTQFDPGVVEAFLKVPETTWLQLRAQSLVTGGAPALQPWPAEAQPRSLDDALSAETERSARYQRPLSLIVLALDDIQGYRERYGEPAANEALRQLGDLLRSNLRGSDIVTRDGADEYVLLLPETDLPAAHATAERLRDAIARHRFAHGQLTASLGVTCRDAIPSLMPKDLLAAAKQALADARQLGRSSVQVRQGAAMGAEGQLPLAA
ncbi:MAG TPA: HD domain-containing phosphohydrolase [Chloroflexota bacterium]|nr:HD domain-containing phosphohydrolase [Chloroflexota bacterium]